MTHRVSPKVLSLTPFPCLCKRHIIPIRIRNSWPQKDPLIISPGAWPSLVLVRLRCTCCSQLVSPRPGRLSSALAVGFAHRLCEAGFLRGCDVLEEFLDEIDVGEDHTAATVALQTDGVEGVTKGVGALVGLVLSVMVGCARWCKACLCARAAKRMGVVWVAYPSSISWVRRSMYFSQRSPTTCVPVNMRRASRSVV
jgi:hypothetical protein